MTLGSQICYTYAVHLEYYSFDKSHLHSVLSYKLAIVLSMKSTNVSNWSHMLNKTEVWLAIQADHYNEHVI